MAEKAAHLTSSLQVKPSIFEVIAQDSLSELLHPSLKLIVQFLGSCNPARYGWLSAWYEEVFLTLNCLLHYHYLETRDSSFAESFYGLCRVERNKKLSSKARFWSLFCVVGLPYLALKMEKYVSSLQDQKVELCYKTLVTSWRGITLVQYLLYLTGRAKAHSPLLSVANLHLQYCPEKDESPVSWSDCFRSPKACLQTIGKSLPQGLELGAFFLQCLQWWHSDESTSKLISSSFIPSPPPCNSDVNEICSTTCPICNQPCRIETALSTSGYVFCYRCIKEALSVEQKCPVTGLPTSTDQLVRLYPDTCV